jgi:hypothetical protein
MKDKGNRIKDLAKFDLCEEFADCFDLPIDYVWQEFVDPTFAEYEEVERILSSYPDPSSPE